MCTKGRGDQLLGLTLIISLICLGLGANLQYHGCFKDRPNRDLAYQRIDPNPLSPAICVAHCRSKGYRFAAVQAGYACFCDNNFGKYGAVGDNECRTKCRGTPSEFCGSGWRNAVYGTSAIANLYLGCHKDSKYRDLRYQRIDPYRLSPAICVEHCKSKGYRFAAVQAGYACFCDNRFGKYGAVSNDECRTTCRRNPSEFCGSGWRNAVYGTSAIGNLYLGCYKDSKNRDLRYQRIDPYRLSPAICVAHCKSKGYRFASVQAGYACFCDNKFGDLGTDNEKKCSTPCRGNKHLKCGGGWRNAVYQVV